jgi:hypothetical protein
VTLVVEDDTLQREAIADLLKDEALEIATPWRYMPAVLAQTTNVMSKDC